MSQAPLAACVNINVLQLWCVFTVIADDLFISGKIPVALLPQTDKVVAVYFSQPWADVCHKYLTKDKNSLGQL